MAEPLSRTAKLSSSMPAPYRTDDLRRILNDSFYPAGAQTQPPLGGLQEFVKKLTNARFRLAKVTKADSRVA